MKKRSNMFTPGQRVNGTLFTIVDSVDPASWHDIVCLCDCGKKVVLPYQKVYYKQYSCGCRRRPRIDSVDYTNTEAYSQTGNKKNGRRVAVVLFDDIRQQWQYTCDCCNDLFFVPRGNERGLARTLRDIAGQDCPNWRKPWYVDRDQSAGHNYAWLSHNGIWIQYTDPKAPRGGWYEIPTGSPFVTRAVELYVPKEQVQLDRRKRGGSIEYTMAHYLIPYYDPKHVIWQGRPKVLAGFKGMPNIPAKIPFYDRYAVVPDTPDALNVIDPDRFNELIEADAAGAEA